MINLVNETIDRNDIDALQEWLAQDPIPKLTKGPLTVELEQKWADKIGTDYSVFVNSGSSAILLVLAALLHTNQLKNNKLLAPSLSWITDVSSPMILGYEVELCDCNLQDLGSDLVHVEKLFQEFDPAVFLHVAPLGLVPDMSRLLQLCEKYDVLLVEDICESMGSKYQGQYLGSFGIASVFSTYFGHHLSTIEGGFINTSDEELYHAMLMLRSHGWARDLPKTAQDKLQQQAGVDSFQNLYTFFMPGMNLRSTDLQAFIGLRAVDKLDKYAENRRRNFLRYKENIEHNQLDIVEQSGDFVSNFAFPIVSDNRSKIVEQLQIAGVECRPLIAGNIARNPFWKKPKTISSLPNADIVHYKGFYVPNHQDLTVEEIEFVCDIINRNNK